MINKPKTWLEINFNSLSKKRKTEILEQFGGDCFKDIEEELENFMAYMTAGKEL